MNKNSFETITFSAGNLTSKITETLENWQQEDKVRRLWAKDASLWTDADEAQWMGWLNIPKLEMDEIARIESLAEKLKASACADVVLLGMGGSSLCVAMMVATFGEHPNYPKLHVLDSTDPQQIHHIETQIDLQNTFFIVSSKSGSTLEPNILKAYFYACLQKVLNTAEVGDRFLAITDPGTKLENMAKTEDFTAIFYGVPSIGGRYSALSNFGMLPSGIMGIEIKNFLEQAEQMARVCAAKTPIADNSAVILGIILGVCAQHGKDKITLVVSPGIHALGAWLEQLLAESTGKIGKGLIPVDQEPLGEPGVYGDDRVFVYVRLDAAPNAGQDDAINILEQAGQVVVRLQLQDKIHLGAELFRWEFATAVAGSVLGINPFNQPDVEASKVRALELTTEYEKTNTLPQLKLLASTNDLQLFTDTRNAQALQTLIVAEASVEHYLKAHLSRIEPSDYFDLAAFIEMNEEHTTLLQQIRLSVRDAKKVATCLGFGPRFLHSTGQAYKGGPNTGVFLQITADHAHDIPVPGHKYSFGLVINAQAQGEFEVLAKRARRVLRVHLGSDVRSGLIELYKLIQKVLSTN